MCITLHPASTEHVKLCKTLSKLASLCSWSEKPYYEDYWIYYHRELQSSLFKRHLSLIVWLSMNMDWLKSLSSCEPTLLSACPSSPPPAPLPSHPPRALWTLQPWKFKGKSAAINHQCRWEEQAPWSSLACWTSHSTIKTPECKSSSVDH